MSFSPIRTERLVIRPMRPDDGESLWERRNDPEVSKYQDWITPFPREQADRIASESAAMGGPASGEKWAAALDLAETGETVGDLMVHAEDDGHTAEIGYSLAAAHWRNGYAFEAVEALVAYLFEEFGADRVWAMVNPENRASAMVLERVGMLFEGHTRLSYWLAGDGSDDWIYGMVREDWEAWRDRVRTPPEEVRLVEVTSENLTAVFGLRTHRSQEAFVAPMARSLAQALRPHTTDDGTPVVPWLRAIEADGVIAGFMMVALVEGRDPYLWRLLVDRAHQRRGVASRAMDLLEDEARAMGGEYLTLGFHEGRGSPAPFYLARGYEVTGFDGETKARKKL
jgi:RimJ/RimL family protein N-acetyltransferase